MKKDLSLSQNIGKQLGNVGARALRLLPPELAHNIAGKFLKYRIIPFKVETKDLLTEVNLKSQLTDKTLIDHPIGLAAGFDKNAQYLAGLCKLGFSFIEAGAATPIAQDGQCKPRVFRYPKERALINRMGFNNFGINKINQHLLDFCAENKNPRPVGLNIGINKQTPLDHALKDYLRVLTNTTAHISYYSLNLSSPNTETLKHLCNPNFLNKLAFHIKSDTNKSLKKIWIKLGPNLKKKRFYNIVETICELGFAGLILTNTYPVNNPEKGGLSGHPLLISSTKALEWAWEIHKGKVPMIGVGGILSGYDIYEKIIRGASLVQIYTALIYRGPYVIPDLLKELLWIMKEAGFKDLEEARGSFYHESC